MVIKSDWTSCLTMDYAVKLFELVDIDNDVFSITHNHIIRTIYRQCMVKV